MGKRVYVYIDGFNLYYGAIKNKPQYKWLDLVAFSERLMGGDNVLKVKYFTAKVLGFQNRKRQETYWDALRHLYPNKIEIIEGFFRTESKHRPIAYYQCDKKPNRSSGNLIWIYDTIEKCTDVNLAVNLLKDAWIDGNQFDISLIVSNDSDLLEALKYIKIELKREVILANPFLWQKWGIADELRKLNLPKRKIKESQLLNCPLPDSISGTSITKPLEWY